jgi:iron(III) transport system ATP-binding protein
MAILRQSRATAIVVTHDAEEAMRMADKIALMNKGSLVQVGSAHEIYTNPVSLFAAGFFSEIDIFEGVAKGGMVETRLGKFPAKFADGTPVSVAIRLGNIEIDEKAGEIPARILSRRFLGETELIQLALAGYDTPVSARVRFGSVHEKLRDVSVFVAKNRALVFESSNESA